mmetsp:Transcript_16474/g.49335  ORF Transcript_16474/g.49335 Transcript_16474/m.49335 type:complete len:898 (+) Transcript_16474:187-2880(+)|eukprot:CAMPEP_0206144018 /NCGR_PEP_ID=MMETSP1473-20131121/22728_1 /ASSEMBLY_ACC=CAM_ASM_001109 /TAXON_ID=1461547 /ORGANISM="Stichococcus sp, Strain RCC1054" /LENGTH=897 /DNA_ID=CAMNT_0053539689 /DNA_START=176 /DNA_END=2869 /DNA_ORIENTATION=-
MVEEKSAGADKKKEDAPKKKKTKQEEQENELSEEDQRLKDDLDLMVTRLEDPEPGLVANAIKAIASEIKTATTSMTSVPKPLKFLRAHYPGMKAIYERMSPSDNRQALADVLSVLAMNAGAEGARESLNFRLQGSKQPVGDWGHEYVRHVAGEIGMEWQDRVEASTSTEDLLVLVHQIVPFHMAHNAEPEAVDLLLEVEQLPVLLQYVDATNFGRCCLYLVSTCAYLPPPDDMEVLLQAFHIYLKFESYPDALMVALRAGNRELQERAFGNCADFLVKQQLCHILARQGAMLDLESGGAAAVEDDDQRATLQAIMSNNRASERFLALARDLDLMAPRTPDEVYKAHLVETRGSSAPALDSARANLANTFVNAFVNAGFGQDKLMTVVPEEGSSGGDNVHWIFKNKDHGKAAATASLGMVTMWDVEGGLPQLDKYLYSKDPHVVAGALLGVGIVNSNIRDEYDPAFALLSEHVSDADTGVRLGAIMGLALAYAGTRREEVRDLLVPLVTDQDVNVEVSGQAALALGIVFCGACEEECVGAALQALMGRGDLELLQPGAKLLVLGLGMLFLGKQDSADATLEVAKTFSEHISQYTAVVIESLAYAGTGDVLKIQQLISIAGEHIEVEEDTQWKAAHQSAAVMGLALVSMAEDLGRDMCHRSLEHLLQYGDPYVRRGVPLAVALLNTSNPGLSAMDMLSRLSHDSDVEVGQNAVLALGIIGAGTNNARLAGLLRQLSAYYHKEPVLLFLVRVAQGLVHMGKGLLTLAPAHAHGQLLNGPALGGLLAVLTSSMDMKATIGGKGASMLYMLSAAIHPRFLMTVDDSGALLPVPVRVGQAVDVVAQAGRPKSITGFQTHTTPVLLNAGERAELGTEQYLALSSTLEGVVILKPNPAWIEPDSK